MSNANGMNKDSGNVEWYTPSWLIDKVRSFYAGRIDLDPASSFRANEVVRATSYFTQGDDGLAREWWGNVWVNHPYGKEEQPCKPNCKKKICTDPNATNYRGHCIDELKPGNDEWSLAICEGSIYADQILGICYNSISEPWCNRIIKNADAICNISPRVAFTNGETGEPQGSCQKGSILYYFGGNVDGFSRLFDGVLVVGNGKEYEGTVLVRHRQAQTINAGLPGQLALI